jgi:hypothetical protein
MDEGDAAWFKNMLNQPENEDESNNNNSNK